MFKSGAQDLFSKADYCNTVYRVFDSFDTFAEDSKRYVIFELAKLTEIK